MQVRCSDDEADRAQSTKKKIQGKKEEEEEREKRGFTRGERDQARHWPEKRREGRGDEENPERLFLDSQKERGENAGKFAHELGKRAGKKKTREEGERPKDHSERNAPATEKNPQKPSVRQRAAIALQ